MRRRRRLTLLISLTLGGLVSAIAMLVLMADPYPKIASHPQEIRIKSLVNQLQNHPSLQRLQGVQIVLEAYGHPLHFFDTHPGLGQILKNDALTRRYRIRYSTQLFEAKTPIPQAALEAILLHELKHILDYSKMDRWEFLQFGWKYVTRSPREVERRTDQFVVDQGFAPGLLAYRRWQEKVLRSEDFAKKEQNYLSLKELLFITGQNTTAAQQH